MKVQMWGYFYRDRDNNLMWKNVIGGYKRVPGQNNWLKPLKRNVYMWFVENITVKCISSRMDSTVLVTWSRRLSHVTNALQSKQPNSHFSEQGKCHHHGWWGDLVLFSLKIFNTSRSFNSLLLLHYVPRGGRRRVFLRILPGLTLPLKKLSNMITPGFQIQSERLLVWKLLILKRETCELISNVTFSHFKIWTGTTWNRTSWKLRSMDGMFGVAVDLPEQISLYVMALVRWIGQKRAQLITHFGRILIWEDWSRPVQWCM